MTKDTKSDEKRDEVLRRMLETPPKPHKPEKDGPKTPETGSKETKS